MDHLIFEWMAEYAADMLNKRQIGHDGKTAYQRSRGKQFLGETYRFAQPNHIHVGKGVCVSTSDMRDLISWTVSVMTLHATVIACLSCLECHVRLTCDRTVRYRDIKSDLTAGSGGSLAYH